MSKKSIAAEVAQTGKLIIAEVVINVLIPIPLVHGGTLYKLNRWAWEVVLESFRYE